MAKKEFTQIEKEKISNIMSNPVKWAYSFLKTYDQVQKKIVPWTARWYQAEVLTDKALRKVARCGRRVG